MSEDVDGANAAEAMTDKATPLWLRASLEDVANVSFEVTLAGKKVDDCHNISELYRSASEVVGGPIDSAVTPETCVFAMLSAVTSMQLQAQQPNEPFRPMWVLQNGSQSPIPSDFRSCVDVLADMARRAENPVLRARLADVSWLLDRKQGALGLAAIAAYTDVAMSIYGYDAKSPDIRILQREAANNLRRALKIGDRVGRDKPATLAAMALVKRFRERAVIEEAPNSIRAFSDLDLEFGISDAAEVGAGLDRVLETMPSNASLYGFVDISKLAARAYHLANMEDDKNRCLSGAAEAFASQAESKTISALQASHLLSNAIAGYHGIPGKKERRKELLHKLIDLQARVPDEMSEYSEAYSVREMAERIQKVFDAGTLLEKLLTFASLETSPDPEKLASDALSVVNDHPLASLFSAAHLDNEGKIIHRSKGDGLRFGYSDPAICLQISKTDEIRRNLIVSAKIEPARHSIMDGHFVTDDLLAAVLRFSIFVPADLLWTFGRGFTRFFQGDFVSATYILTPLLENSLRYLLKSSGHEVTKFDDATQTQEDRTISALFEQMRPELESVLTPAIAADIERVFLIKPGPYLRHAVSHGLLHDSSPYSADSIYGCWLIFRLCLMPLLGKIEQLRAVFDGSELARG